MLIFKLSFLSYMPTALYFLFIIQIVLSCSILWKITRKSLNLQIFDTFVDRDLPAFSVRGYDCTTIHIIVPFTEDSFGHS